jgi:tetratricopeptide (TPR) repeat protein
MGFLLRAQGKLDQAEPLYLEALEKRRRVLGEEHPNTLESLNSVASTLQEQSRLAEAEPYYREALAKRRRVLGEDHPLTFESINNMGFLLRARGNVAEADPYDREALAKRRRVLGEEHPDTLISVNNLAGLLVALGRHAEAEPYFRDAAEKSRRVQGEQHPFTLICTVNLGRVLQRQAKHQEAIDLLTPIEVAARIGFTGGSAPRLAVVLATLGRARVGLGYAAERFALAEANFLETHRILVGARGATHKDTLECVQDLTDLCTAWNRAEPGKGYDGKAAEWRAKLAGGAVGTEK